MRRMIAVVALATGAAYGATVNFPDADGSHDLASKTAWGGTLPGADDVVAITGAVDVAVHASADVRFGQLQNMLTAGKGYTLTFDQSLHPDVKLGFDGFQFNGKGLNKVHTRFTGGFWDFGGKTFATGNNNTSYGNSRHLSVDGGAVLTNISDIALGYTGQNDLLFDVSGNAKVYSAGRFKVTNGKAVTATSSNIVRIHDGGLLSVGGDYEWENDAASVTNVSFFKDYLIVSNGELRVNGNYLYLGRYNASMTHITANGKVTANSVIGATSKTSCNRVVVDNGGEFNAGTFYGGWKPDANLPDRHNRFEVLSGGKASFSTFYLGFGRVLDGVDCGASGNTLVVSNGEFVVSNKCGGYNAACSNLTILVQGTNAVFSAFGGKAFCMFPAPYCEFCIDEGFTYKLPCWFGYNTAGGYTNGIHHQTFRIRRGATYQAEEHTGNMASVNCGADTLFSWGDRIIAEDGGRIEGLALHCTGFESEIRIDNSTVVLTNSTLDSQFSIGYSNAWGGMGTNCTLTIAGDRPQIDVSGSVSFYRCSHLVFELPENGYQEGIVPIRAGERLVVNSGSDMTFTGAEAMYAAHCAAGKCASYVLFEQPKEKAFVSNAVLEAARANLGPHFRLFKRVTEDKNQLVMTVRVPVGGAIIIR